MKKVFLFILTFCFLQTDIINATNTDISGISNVIYIQPFEVEQGSTNYAMSIKMKNTADIRGFQFDLVLPDGVSPVVEDGVILCGLNKERSPQNALGTLYHTIEASRQDDGSYRFLCGSQQEKTFLGNDGEVAVVYVNIASDMATGDYPVILKNIKLTETDISKFYETELLESTVTITEAGDDYIKFNEDSSTLPAYTAGEKGNVRMTRNIKANTWSTIVLPFTLSKAKAESVFGSDVQLAEFDGFETTYDDEDVPIPSSLTIKFKTYQLANTKPVKGGKPFLIKTSKDITKIEATECTLADAVTPTNGSDPEYELAGKFTGSLVKTKVPEDGLFLSDNKFWYSTGKTNIKAFRGWFELGAVLDKETDFEVKMLVMVDDDPTMVEGISTDVPQGAIYDLSGRKLEKVPQKGIYLINGKKILK